MRHRAPKYKIVAARIADYMERHGLTQTDLARRAGLTKMCISQWVREARPRLEAGALDKLNAVMPGIDLVTLDVIPGAGKRELKLIPQRKRLSIQNAVITPPRAGVQAVARTARDLAKIEKTFSSNFASNLAAYLRETRTTQVAMAAAAGVSQSIVRRYALGSSTPSASRAQIIADVMGVTLDEMLKTRIFRN